MVLPKFEQDANAEVFTPCEARMFENVLPRLVSVGAQKPKGRQPPLRSTSLGKLAFAIRGNAEGVPRMQYCEWLNVET